MRWEDERYIRIYTRDSVGWLGLSFIAQALFCLILRKVDRAGLMKLGRPGKRGVAIMLGFAGEWPRLEPALEELIEDGCVRIQGEWLVVPNFIEAQEASMSDKQRKTESRARARDLAAASEVLNPDKTSGSVTSSHESGQYVTTGHDTSQAVTPNQPSQAEPTEPAEPQHRRGGYPLKSELVGGMNPGTSALRLRLAEEGLDLSWPAADKRSDVEAAVARCGVEPCVAACLADAAGMKTPPKSLGIFAPTLARLRPRPSLVAEASPWWARATPETLARFERERCEIDPELRGAPQAALGARHVDAVRDLIARYETEARQ